MKLHYKLFLFFASVVLLPLLVATVAASVMLGKSGTDSYESRISSGLAASSAIISSQVMTLNDDLETSLQAPEIQALVSGDPVRASAALDTLLRITEADRVLLADADGITFAAAGGGSAEGTLDLKSRAALQGAGGTAWEVTIYRGLETGTIAGVFDNLGLEWGMIVDSSLRQGSLPQDSEIVDENGKPLEASASSGTGDDFRVTVIDGIEMFSSLVALPSETTNGVTMLFAGVDQDVVGDATRQVLILGAAVMLGVASLAAVLGYYLTRTMTGPLRELTAAARAGIDGNLERRVSIKSNDELGSLASSFNQMQDSISQHIGDIEESRTQMLLALSYAGEILESTTDREKLIEVTAQAARLAAGVDGVMVELFEKGGLSGHEGIVRRVPASLFEGDIRERASDISRAAAEGRVAPGETVEANGSFNLIIFPLMHDRNALGTLVAVFQQDKPLDEGGRKILGSLAFQAASALANVSYGELQHSLAITDQMTGLYNYRYLEEYLERELNRSRRYEHSMTVAIADLDDFKEVNDRYGHPAGDALLHAVAEALRTNVRESDVVARYGGEEFVVVFPETRKAAAKRVLEKLRREVARVSLDDYPEIETTISIGVAGYPDDAERQGDLLKRADDALYRSKLAGKNRVSAA